MYKMEHYDWLSIGPFESPQRVLRQHERLKKINVAVFF